MNPNGCVGARRLDNGEVLSERSAILLYLAGLSRDTLALPEDEIQHAQVHSMLFFLSAELHPSFRPQFYPGSTQDTHKAIQHLFNRIDYVEANRAGDRRFLFGDRPSVADIYVFAMLGWLDHFGIGMERWPGLDGLAGRIALFDSTRQALAVETETRRPTRATPP